VATWHLEHRLRFVSCLEHPKQMGGDMSSLESGPSAYPSSTHCFQSKFDCVMIMMNE
jgi:hypothetical protein